MGYVPEGQVEFRVARPADIATYVSLARAAQQWLRARGLGQYLPAAHDEYAGLVWTRVEAGTLYAVCVGNVPIAFFSLETLRSAWWPPDDVRAVYLAGLVVAPEMRGHGIGDAIIRWCVGETLRRDCRAIRIDCHAGNPWLRRYYEARGFTLRGQVEQHPGYVGCLFERDVAPTDAEWANLHPTGT